MQKPKFTDKEALERSIKISEENIKRFEIAIESERNKIFEYKMYIKEIEAWNRAHGQ